MLLQEESTPTKTKLLASTPKNKSRQLGAKLSVQTPQKNSVSSMPRFGRSPPNRDPGPTQLEVDKKGSLSQEFQKLQNELDVFIQKVEELTKKGKRGHKNYFMEPIQQSQFFSRSIVV